MTLSISIEVDVKDLSLRLARTAKLENFSGSTSSHAARQSASISLSTGFATA